jgi:hypothetical protein
MNEANEGEGPEQDEHVELIAERIANIAQLAACHADGMSRNRGDVAVVTAMHHIVDMGRASV